MNAAAQREVLKKGRGINCIGHQKSLIYFSHLTTFVHFFASWQSQFWGGHGAMLPKNVPELNALRCK